MEITRTATITFLKENEGVSAEIQQLIEAAENARNRAYAPYSEFKVGSAILTDDGQVFEGNNQENAAYPSGLCAERVVLFNWGANHSKTKVLHLAISVEALGKLQPSKDIVSPCGSCLQVMSEVENRQETPINIYISTGTGIYFAKGVEQFLPFPFSTKL